MRQVLELDSIDSTQDAARRMAEDGAPEWSQVIAKRQTSGRGRIERKWNSAPGGLYASIILRPQISPAELGELNFLAADSIARALAQATGLQTTVKAPNDVLAAPANTPDYSHPEPAIRATRATTAKWRPFTRHGFKKVCGILLEASGDSHRTEWVVLGIGVNVNNPTAPGLPHAASLQELAGHPFEISEVLAKILAQLQKSYSENLCKT